MTSMIDFGLATVVVEALYPLLPLRPPRFPLDLGIVGSSFRHNSDRLLDTCARLMNMPL